MNKTTASIVAAIYLSSTFNAGNAPVEVHEFPPMEIKASNVQKIEFSPLQINAQNIQKLDIDSPLFITAESEEVSFDEGEGFEYIASATSDQFDDNGTANLEMLNQVHHIIWPSK